MNERIKELAKQVDAHFINNHNLSVLFDEREDFEKFAELLVQECAGIVDRAISDGGVDGQVLKQHFGIEL